MDPIIKLQQIFSQNGINNLDTNILNIVDDFLANPLNNQETVFDKCIVSIIKCVYLTENEIAPVKIHNIKSDTGEIFDINILTTLIFSMGSSEYNNLMLRLKTAIILLQFKDRVKLVFTDDKIAVFHKEHHMVLVDVFETLKLIYNNAYRIGFKIVELADNRADKFVEYLSNKDNKRKFAETIKKDVASFCESYTKDFYLTHLK